MKTKTDKPRIPNWIREFLMNRNSACIRDSHSTKTTDHCPHSNRCIASSDGQISDSNLTV